VKATTIRNEINKNQKFLINLSIIT
jgi:hypothetical protein